MYQYVDWQLYNNDKLVIDLKNLKCTLDNNILFVKEENVDNLIDINNKTYNRIAKDYKLYIDFEEKTCEFTFENGEKCKIDIECDFNNTDKEIKMIYKYDEKIKKIIIRPRMEEL